MSKTRILIIRFKNILQKREVELFRGAVLNKLKDNIDILFHNHKEEGYRYAYPLIQYKRINQKAAIVCLQQGVDVIGNFFSVSNTEISLKGRRLQLEIDSVNPAQFQLQIGDNLRLYQIRKWIPLNKENLEKYNTFPGIGQKYEFLEHILIGNILSCAKGLGVHFEKEVICHIIQIDEPFFVTYKGLQFISFDLKFKSNTSLPDYIGLGKGASLNHGTIVQLEK